MLILANRVPWGAWCERPRAGTPTDCHADLPAAQRIEINFCAVDLDRPNEIGREVFTPCMPANPLLEAVSEAAGNATSGDVVLLSPASSGLDQSRNHPHRAARLCSAVKSIGWGGVLPNPNIHGLLATRFNAWAANVKMQQNLLRGFFEKKPRGKTKIKEPQSR